MQRRRFATLTVLAVAILAVLAVGCGGKSDRAAAPTSAAVKEFTVEMKLDGHWKFVPAEIGVNRGDRVKVTLKNSDVVVHDFVIQELNVRSAKVQPGQEGTVEFTANRTGTFDFFCDEAGHRPAGMVGKLTVR